jgi:hypothetical protein
VADLGPPNVSVARHPAGIPVFPIRRSNGGTRPNIIVVVYRSGDEVVVPSIEGKSDQLVTLIILEDDDVLGDDNERTRAVRAMADLFLTTSDRDFVFELVSNLAS